MGRVRHALNRTRLEPLLGKPSRSGPTAPQPDKPEALRTLSGRKGLSFGMRPSEETNNIGARATFRFSSETGPESASSRKTSRCIRPRGALSFRHRCTTDLVHNNTAKILIFFFTFPCPSFTLEARLGGFLPCGPASEPFFVSADRHPPGAARPPPASRRKTPSLLRRTPCGRTSSSSTAN